MPGARQQRGRQHHQRTPPPRGGDGALDQVGGDRRVGRRLGDRQQHVRVVRRLRVRLEDRRRTLGRIGGLGVAAGVPQRRRQGDAGAKLGLAALGRKLARAGGERHGPIAVRAARSVDQQLRGQLRILARDAAGGRLELGAGHPRVAVAQLRQRAQPGDPSRRHRIAARVAHPLQRLERPVGRPGAPRRLRRGDPPAPSRVLVRAQVGRTLQHDQLRLTAAALGEPRRRPLQLRRHVLVRTGRRLGQVQRAAVAVSRLLQRVGQQPVRRPSVLRGRGLVDRRPHQRMCELEPAVADRHQPGPLGLVQLAAVGVVHCGALDHQQRLGVGRRGPQQRLAGAGRELEHLREERPRQDVGRRQRVRQRVAAGQLARGQRRRQVLQGERVACGRGGQLAGDLGGHLGARLAGEQLPGVVCAEPLQLEHLDARRRELGHRRPHGEHHRDPLGAEPARGEHQRLRRRRVQPVDIVDQADDGQLGRCRREQAERGSPDRQPVGRRAGRHRQRVLQRLTLGLGQVGGQRQHRPEQLVERREGERVLGLHTAHPQHGRPVRVAGDAVEQGRLAHPGLAADEQRAAAAGLRGGDQAVKAVAGSRPADQGRTGFTARRRSPRSPTAAPPRPARRGSPWRSPSASGRSATPSPDSG